MKKDQVEMDAKAVRSTHSYENGRKMISTLTTMIGSLELPLPPPEPTTMSRRDTSFSCRKEPVYVLDDEDTMERARIQRLEHLSDYNSQRIDRVHQIEVSSFNMK